MLHPEILVIFYADDGILYLNVKFDPSLLLDNLDPRTGISVHAEGPKRGWVKHDGQWKKN